MMPLKILLLTSVSFVFLRFLLLRRWSRSQCPRCGHSFLIRTKRGLFDRIFSSFFIAPLRKYQCQFYSCHWRGVAHYSRHSKQKKPEKLAVHHTNNKHTVIKYKKVEYIEGEDTESKYIKTEYSGKEQIGIQYNEIERKETKNTQTENIQTKDKDFESSQSRPKEFKSLHASSVSAQKSPQAETYSQPSVIVDTEKTDLFTSEVSLYRRLEDNNEFIVKYQPIVNIKNNNILGMEALLRWQHPERGLIPPHEFIPVADRNTLIIPIGKWALTQACLQAKIWQNRNIQPLFVSVNISPRHFYLPTLIQTIEEILEKNELSPQFLELDVSTSTLNKDLESAKKVLMELRTQGIRVCLDNFDISSLSLEHLDQSLFSTIKTHVSLIQDLPSQPKAYERLESILSLSLELGFNVVAKGVETREQLGLIRSLGCEIVQGYLFDPPLVPEDATDVLRANWVGRPDDLFRSTASVNLI
jgi:EAL domain-containing protein (putative c-di-GMP-specific phosphodiesterase class I)